MTKIELNEEQLAEIEAAAKKAAPAIWHQNNPPTHEVYGVTEEGDFGTEYSTVALTIQPTAAAHIVATQPCVALAMVAEIRRLRTEVETLRDVSRRVLNVGHNNDCLFCGFKDRTASEALHNEKEKQ
jgi:hypothetical protein